MGEASVLDLYSFQSRMFYGCSRHSGVVVVVSDVVRKRNDSFNYVFSKPEIHGVTERERERVRDRLKAEMSRAREQEQGLEANEFFACDLTFRKHLIKFCFACVLVD